MAKGNFNKYRVKPNTDKPQVLADPILNFFNGGFLMPAKQGGILAYPYNNNQSGYVAPRMDTGGFNTTTQTTTPPWLKGLGAAMSAQGALNPVMSGVGNIINYFSGSNKPSTQQSTQTTPTDQKSMYEQMYDLYSNSLDKFYKEHPFIDKVPYSGKTIRLTKGRLTGADIDTGLLDHIKKIAAANKMDPYRLAALISRESTFGVGTGKDRAGSSRNLVSGWNVDEDYIPYDLDRFLADRRVPGMGSSRETRGWNFWVDDRNKVAKYLSAHPQLLQQYQKKLNSIKKLDRNINYFDLASQWINRPGGVRRYNPGARDYETLYNQDLNLLHKDPAFSKYFGTKENGGPVGIYGYRNYNQNILSNKAMGGMTPCPKGQVWDEKLQKCIPIIPGYEAFDPYGDRKEPFVPEAGGIFMKDRNPVPNVIYTPSVDIRNDKKFKDLIQSLNKQAYGGDINTLAKMNEGGPGDGKFVPPVYTRDPRDYQRWADSVKNFNESIAHLASSRKNVKKNIDDYSVFSKEGVASAIGNLFDRDVRQIRPKYAEQDIPRTAWYDNTSEKEQPIKAILIGDPKFNGSYVFPVGARTNMYDKQKFFQNDWANSHTYSDLYNDVVPIYPKPVRQNLQLINPPTGGNNKLKKVIVPTPQPSLKKKVIDYKRLPYNRPQQVGVTSSGLSPVSIPPIQKGPTRVGWNVEYFDPNIKGITSRYFNTNEEAEKFYNDPANDVRAKYSDVSSYEKRAYGGSISKFEDGGWLEDYAEYANGGQQWLTKYAPGGPVKCGPGQVSINGKCIAINSDEYKKAYNKGIGRWVVYDQGTRTWKQSDASNPNAEWTSSVKTLPEVKVISKANPYITKARKLALNEVGSFDAFRQQKEASYPAWYKRSSLYNPDKDLANQRSEYDKLVNTRLYQNVLDAIPQNKGENRLAYMNRLNSLAGKNFVNNAKEYGLTEPFDPSNLDLMAQWGKKGLHHLGALAQSVNNPFGAPSYISSAIIEGNKPVKGLTADEAKEVGITQPFETSDNLAYNYFLKPTMKGLSRTFENITPEIEKSSRYMGPSETDRVFTSILNPLNYIGPGELLSGGKNLIKGSELLKNTAFNIPSVGKDIYSSIAARRIPLDINYNPYAATSELTGNLDEIRRAYHNSERYLTPAETQQLHKYGHGLAENYITPAATNIDTRTQAQRIIDRFSQPSPEQIGRFNSLNNQLSSIIPKNFKTVEKFEDWYRKHFPTYASHFQESITREALQASKGQYRSLEDLKNAVTNGNLTELEGVNKIHNALRRYTNDFTSPRFRSGENTRSFTFGNTDNNVLRNLSGLTKEEALEKASLKDKDIISKMSENEFRQTVVKPTGEVVSYSKPLDVSDKIGYNSGLRQMQITGTEPLTTAEYADQFNARLDLLNDIIRQNNKSGVDYAVTGLDPNGNLRFTGPTGQSSWTVEINPGMWRGEIEDIANTEYLKSIPGINMKNTTNTVFGDLTTRRGTKAYESINEYLKRLDLGRVKSGFNSQSSTSKPLWENAIKSGKAFGFYNSPGTVYGAMRTIVPVVGTGALGAAALNQEKYGGEQWLTKYAPGGAASPQVCYDKNGNIVPCAPGAHRTLIFTENPAITAPDKVLADTRENEIKNNEFTKEAEDLKNYLIKNQPGEDIEIYPTYKSYEDDRIITTNRDKTLNEILKTSDAKTRLVFMAHHGDNLFGQPYSQLGKKLQATTYDNCYLGSCFSGDIASSPEFKGLTNFHYRPGYGDNPELIEKYYRNPGLRWLGVNPNKNTQTGEAGVNNAFFNTSYNIANEVVVNKKLDDLYNQKDKLLNKYKDVTISIYDKRHPGHKEFRDIRNKITRGVYELNKLRSAKIVNPKKGVEYDINNPTNQPHIGKGSTLWFGDMFNNNPQKYNTLDNWNLNRQPIRGRDYKKGGSVNNWLDRYDDGGGFATTETTTINPGWSMATSVPEWGAKTTPVVQKPAVTKKVVETPKKLPAKKSYPGRPATLEEWQAYNTPSSQTVTTGSYRLPTDAEWEAYQKKKGVPTVNINKKIPVGWHVGDQDVVQNTSTPQLTESQKFQFKNPYITPNPDLNDTDPRLPEYWWSEKGWNPEKQMTTEGMTAFARLYPNFANPDTDREWVNVDDERGAWKKRVYPWQIPGSPQYKAYAEISQLEKEKNELLGKTAVQLLDPSGISMWGDTWQSYKDLYNKPGLWNATIAGVNTVASLPLVKYFGEEVAVPVKGGEAAAKVAEITTKLDKLYSKYPEISRFQKMMNFGKKGMRYLSNSDIGKLVHYVGGEPFMKYFDKATGAEKLFKLPTTGFIPSVNKMERFGKASIDLPINLYVNNANIKDIKNEIGQSTNQFYNFKRADGSVFQINKEVQDKQLAGSIPWEAQDPNWDKKGTVIPLLDNETLNSLGIYIPAMYNSKQKSQTKIKKLPNKK